MSTDRQRGIFFISENRKVIDIMPMIDNKRPIEQAIGYGTKPLEVVEGPDDVIQAKNQSSFAKLLGLIRIAPG